MLTLWPRRFRHPSAAALLRVSEGESSNWLDRVVQGHVRRCAACRARTREMLRSLDALGELAREAPAESPQDEIRFLRARDRLRQAIAAERSPREAHPAARPSVRGPWPARLALAAGCAAAVVGLGFGLHRFLDANTNPAAPAAAVPELIHTPRAILPNPVLTPGAVAPVSPSLLCAMHSDPVVSPVPRQLARRVLRDYDIERSQSSSYELDYLITPGLGGVGKVANIWPEPHDARWNSRVKDQLESFLHGAVCSGRVSLPTAQRAIASNWIAAYQHYFHTRLPLPGNQRAFRPAKSFRLLAGLFEQPTLGSAEIVDSTRHIGRF